MRLGHPVASDTRVSGATFVCMCMHTHLYACVCTHICMHMYVHTFVCICMYTHLYACVCTHLYACVCTHICMHVYAHTFVCMCMYTHLYACVCTHICIICTYTHLHACCTAYCIRSTISSISKLNRLCSSRHLFRHVPLKRDQLDCRMGVSFIK